MVRLGNYNQFKKSHCEVCGTSQNLTIDHVLTRGAHPDLINDPANCMTLCMDCHMEKGRVGLVTFANRYKKVKDWMLSNGFFFEAGKWRRSQ